MRFFKELIREYNKNWMRKSQVAESAINVLFNGGRFGDYLTFLFAFLCKLLEKRGTKSKSPRNWNRENSYWSVKQDLEDTATDK